MAFLVKNYRVVLESKATGKRVGVWNVSDTLINLQKRVKTWMDSKGLERTNYAIINAVLNGKPRLHDIYVYDTDNHDGWYLER